MKLGFRWSWPAFFIAALALVLAVFICASRAKAAAQPPVSMPVMAQVDRFEEGGDGEWWAVVSIDGPPYSLSFPAENDFEDLRPGDWVILTLDARGQVVV